MKTLQFLGKKPGMIHQVPLEEKEDRQVQEETEVAMAHQPRETTTVSHIAMESYTAAATDVAATTPLHPEEEGPEEMNLGL